MRGKKVGKGRYSPKGPVVLSRRQFDELRSDLVSVILRLSVHPAGAEDWEWYEWLCLSCADELDDVVQRVWRKKC